MQTTHLQLAVDLHKSFNSSDLYSWIRAVLALFGESDVVRTNWKYFVIIHPAPTGWSRLPSSSMAIRLRLQPTGVRFSFLFKNEFSPLGINSSSRHSRKMGSLGTRKANVLIVGSGGVGTMAAYALEKTGKAAVTSVLRSNFSVVERNGFNINSLDHGDIKGWKPTQIRNSVPDVAQEVGLQPYDFVVVTTKNVADVPPSVADIIALAITPGHTAITLLQNGLNIEKPLISAFPQNPIISGISFIGATEGPLGTIKHDDHDTLVVGAFPNPNVDNEVSEAAARRFVDAYSCPGIDCVYEPDVRFWRWRKLLYNSSYNTVATILRMDTSRMRVSEHIIDSLIRPLMQEIQATALAAAGVDLPDELIERMITIDTFEAFFKPSMMQDIEKGNYIEFENIVGEPLREAESVGIPTPTLKVIYELLKGLQWQTKEAKGLIKVPTKSEPGLKYGTKHPRVVT
ncbi:ketopantoate reductase PanE/ApbA C terminal-domain-containing protein [Podospora didyma]|uniref:Ketopantoate reductase PanE/ApbA C terminal-domain-containing protein n=1 Tax=Podospora didyma TaxID=330526 RepID=A0AAE0U0F9_9PEZI|nr:ketopantoate reductase PanE/ApbA C terminal-domain-containing protein [Podospora didyma]